ncbi:PPOX class F420-dependent oxidoreductase [Rhodococcus sp. PvR099]|uniref:PPOX class F420-dependent oxidoreductase n=1 Tax=Rhodococcus sp. PvR099 TaxID=2806602 RepID=UPI001AE54DC8|nr:PPOX class F420-dependent oxidoreductase [Rhodococcus sp. PvR099]MBP1161349.1 PPOX class probable F420-dependent enzyme [Rhodococcus sp. PvR099]
MTEQIPPEPIAAAKVVLLQTRKRDGSWVDTPVNIAVDGSHTYFRTPGRASKNKRLRNFPEVRMWPCIWSGKPTGEEADATAHLLTGTEADAAGRAIDRRFPILQRVMVRAAHKVMRTPTLHYELTDFHAP